MGLIASEFPLDCCTAEDMLDSMQQAAAATQSSTTPDFAGLLAALTTPARKAEPAWNDADLADDVATLSYERALRTHARYKPADQGDRALTQIAGSETMSRLTQDDFPAQTAMKPKAREWGEQAEQTAAADLSRVLGQDRKCASITIRMSKPECEQLHQRAAEAGLTVSAYLRSCTFEAEALRAQVKQALAELHKARAAESQHTNAVRPSWIQRLFRRHA